MDKISPIKEKILYFLEKQGITKVDFCEKTGIAYANLKGKGLFSEIGGTQIGKILSVYSEISPEWLLTGQGSMLRETKTNCTETHKTPDLTGGKNSDSKTKDSDNNAPVQEKSDITDKFSVNDLVKAITNLSEAAIINAEANNRQSKNIERMLDMLSGDIGTYQRKTVVQGCVDMCNTA